MAREAPTFAEDCFHCGGVLSWKLPPSLSSRLSALLGAVACNCLARRYMVAEVSDFVILIPIQF
jgi:hypothetical protein